MIETAIMIEGQMGLNWQRWKLMAQAVENFGFAGLYRSDHFVNPNPPDQDSLELWISLTWLASHTQRIEFGPLVTPTSFRHPVHTARMGAAVDSLSDGRLTLGLGAGWQEREHEMFGWDLLDIEDRFQRFEEGLQVITGLIAPDERQSFEGEYYSLKDAVLLPRPERQGGPPILIGGNGFKYTLPLAARFADEWNAVFLSPQEFEKRNQALDELLRERQRDPGEVRRSLMTGCIFGRDHAEVEKLVQARTQGKRTVEELRQRGMVVGVADEIAVQLKRLAEAGVQRVMLQWLELDDIDRLETMAMQLLPQLR